MLVVLIALLAIAALADALTTIRFLKDGRSEGNPIGRWFHEAFGNVAGSILAKAVQVAFLIGVAAILGAT